MRSIPLIALAFVACGGTSRQEPKSAPPAPTVERAFGAALPKGFELALVWNVESIGPQTLHLRIRLDPAGRPFALVNDVVFPLMLLPSGAEPKPVQLAKVRIEDFAWVDEGVMLVVVDRALDLVTPAGLVQIAELPAPGMHVSRAAADKCWLFDGKGDRAGAVLLFDQKDGLHSVIEFPKRARAVVGTPSRAHVATEGSIIRIALGSPMQLVYDGDDEILALADAGEAGVFFSTLRGVFYLGDDGTLVHLMNESATDLHTAADQLFLVFDGVGVARGAPVSAFRALKVDAP